MHGTARVIREVGDCRRRDIAEERSGSCSQLEGFTIHGSGILATPCRSVKNCLWGEMEFRVVDAVWAR